MRFDLRLLQIFFLSIFLTYGITQLSWDISFEQVAILVVTSLLTQSMYCLAFNIPINTIKSAIITSLGLAIILRSNYTFIFVLAAFFAIGSKYIFRSNNKHFINPANFGTVFVVLFTGLAWISPVVWNFGTILVFVTGSSALIFMTNPKKLDLSLSFILFYFLMQFLWSFYYKDEPIDHFMNHICSGSVVLVAFFMISDPSSTPNSRVARILWVFLVALLSFYLSAFHSVQGAPMYGLFVLSPLVPLLDFFAKDSIFAWDSMQRRILHSNVDG